MRKTLTRAAFAATVVGLGLGGVARAQGGQDCDKIEEPLAYNACLAEHGPKARLVAPDGKRAPRGVVFAMHDHRARHGRVHLEIPIGSSRR